MSARTDCHVGRHWWWPFAFRGGYQVDRCRNCQAQRTHEVIR